MHIAPLSVENLKSFLSDDEGLGDWLDHNIDESRECLDLGKTWDGINFMLEQAMVTPGLLSVGTEVGEDLGYGRPRLSDVRETASFSDNLNTCLSSNIEQYFDFERFERREIYPNVWTRKDLNDKAGVIEQFRALCNFTMTRKVRGEGMCLVLL